MKITKRRLRRIIREEYSRLKKSMLIRESNIGNEFAYKLTELMLSGELANVKQAYELAESLGAVEVDSWQERPSEHGLGTRVEFAIIAPDLTEQINQKANQLGGPWQRDYLFDIYEMRGKAYFSIHVD